MATQNALIKLYKNCKIVPEKNFLVEEVEDYLSTLTGTITLPDYNYKKQDSAITLKIDTSDVSILVDSPDLLDWAEAQYYYNYASVKNDAESKPTYYFITGRQYNANKTLDLLLERDSINTFELNEDYEFDKRTEVIREHRDRIYNNPVQKFYDNKYGAHEYIQYNGLNNDTITTPDGNITVRVDERLTTQTLGGHKYYPASYNNLCFLYSENDNQIYYSNNVIHYNPGPALKTAYPRRIDFISEGIISQLYKNNEIDIIDNDANYDWYLMFITAAQDPQDPDYNLPFDTCIISNETLKVKTAESGYYEISSSVLLDNTFYWFGNNLVGTQSNNKIRFSDNYETDITDFMCLYKSASRVYLIKYIGDYANIGKPNILRRENVHNITATGSSIRFYTTNNLIKCTQAQQAIISQGNFAGLGTRILNNNSGTISPADPRGDEITLNNIYDVVRTDPKIVKIIKLPYCPFDIKLGASDTLILPSYLTTKSITTQETTNLFITVKPDYTGYFSNEIANNLTIYEDLFVDLPDETFRDDKIESKIYHSDFTQKKLVYDSFGYPIKWETLSEDFIKSLTAADTLKLKFMTTSTVNSKFLFDLGNSIKSDNKLTEDYPTILPISRNNELPIYNSEYLNYIKNGYNYDKKQAVWQTIGGVGQLISAGIGGYAGIAGLSSGGSSSAVQALIDSQVKRYSAPSYQKQQGLANYAERELEKLNSAKSELARLSKFGRNTSGLTSIQGLSAISNSVFGIANGISTIANAQNNLNQKLAQAQMQSVSVVGSDDVDLCSYYTNNRAKLVDYQVGDNMKNHILDLFYYGGYSTNETKVPDLTTRKDFNFLQADAILKNKTNVNEECLEDLKARWSIGITVLHKHNNSWDFDQTKANLESWIIG